MAGQDRANPIGTILSTAMLCRWSLAREDAAVAIEGAVTAAIDDGYRTADLMPVDGTPGALRQVGTAAMAEAIVGRLARTGAPTVQVGR